MRDPAFGDYTAAKLDFLTAARSRIDNDCGVYPGIVVNRMYCRPLHPHGKRMLRDGLMVLHRANRQTPSTANKGRKKPSSAYTLLVITDKGLAELARLEKRAARRARKFN